MLLLNLWKYIRGYVVIHVEGFFIERFINLCSTRNIKLWDIKRNSDSILIAKIDVKKFKKLKRIAKISKCRITIQKKTGLPFLFKRYKNRKMFFALLFSIIVITIILSSFIWKIEVKGEFSIPITEINAVLEKSGLKIGKLKKVIDIEEIKSKVKLTRNDIAWIGIELKGVKAIVEIVPKVDKPDMIDKDEPCNIVSDKEGIIAKILAREGIKMVNENDMVSVGQVLISGIISSKFASDRYVHADGEIYIKTWYTEKILIPYERDLVSLTGEEEKRYKLKVFDFEINLLNTSTKFEIYDKISETNKLRVFGLFELPIQVTKDTYKDISIESIKYSENQAEGIAKNDAMIGALKKVPKDAEIVNNKVNIIKGQEGVEAEVVVECLEKVGTKEKIGG